MAEPELSLRRTIYLVPDLHCSSCANHVEEAINQLEPKPVAVSHSFVDHTVTVHHAPSLSVVAIAQAIEDAGYELFDVINDPYTRGSALDKRFIDKHTSPPFEQVVAYQRPTANDSASLKRKRHIENCDLCRSKQQSGAASGAQAPPARSDSVNSATGLLQSVSPSRHLVIEKNTDKSVKQFNDVVIGPSDKPTSMLEAVVAIGGMTCASCVRTITKALEEKPWVESVNVSLLANSALVQFSEKSRTDELVEAIEELGYDASVESVNYRTTKVDETRTGQKNVWRATYSIGGMTCASCVTTISNALKELSYVQEADVTLLSNTGVVVFEGKEHLDQIRSVIEDVGYEAQIDSVEEVGAGAKNERRTVAVQVNGMYCEHCPPKVEQALEKFGDAVQVGELPTIDHPILTVSYTPQPPSLTVRHLLAVISEADPAFEPTIYHPMSLEERSRAMQQREQWRLLYRVMLSIVAAVPTFIIGIVYMNLVDHGNSGYQYLMRRVGGTTRAELATFIIATPVYFFAADIFHRRTLKEIRSLWKRGSTMPIWKRFYRFGSMNMLISFGTTIAYFASIAEMGIAATQRMHGMVQSYFDSVVFLTMFLLIGRLIEAYSKAKTGDAVVALGKLRPAEALLFTQDTSSDEVSNQGPRMVIVDLLERGDIIRVAHGGSPACDGVIVDGETRFDESSLTGESKLVFKKTRDSVFSGSINQGAAVSVRVTEIGGTSMLDQIVNAVREGQTRRAPVERIADTLTAYFVPVITLIAIATWLIWLLLGLSGAIPADYRDTDVGGWPFWSLQFAIAVFVIACPCGLGLAAPTALFVGGGLAAKYGILVKGGGQAFQEASNLDIVVFDKTGTLTEGGQPKTTDHLIRDVEKLDVDKDTLLACVDRLEKDSSHPIAKAIHQFCSSHASPGLESNYTEEVGGKGMRGSFRDDRGIFIEVLVGNEALMDDHDIQGDSEMTQATTSWKERGNSIAIVAVRTAKPESPESFSPWLFYAAFAISDSIRAEAPGIIHALQKRGIAVWMISGDNPTTAYAVGSRVGIPRSNIIAGVLPTEKAEKIKHLQKSQTSHGRAAERAMVAMVGDGINDSPALTMADVGIAIGSGSDIALSSAKFVLVTSNLQSILTLIDLSRAVFRRIKFNFAWAAVYNAVALPVAAGVFYPIVLPGGGHVRLDPIWAALAMALSSVSVVMSSLLLRSKLPVVGFRVRK